MIVSNKKKAWIAAALAAVLLVAAGCGAANQDGNGEAVVTPSAAAQTDVVEPTPTPTAEVTEKPSEEPILGQEVSLPPTIEYKYVMPAQFLLILIRN